MDKTRKTLDPTQTNENAIGGSRTQHSRYDYENRDHQHVKIVTKLCQYWLAFKLHSTMENQGGPVVTQK